MRTRFACICVVLLVLSIVCIMAYGEGSLTVTSFDDKTEDDAFLEVTGITEAGNG